MKARILNSLVANAADVMEAQLEINQIKINELMFAGGCSATDGYVEFLRRENKSIFAAVIVMRSKKGEWA